MIELCNLIAAEAMHAKLSGRNPAAYTRRFVWNAMLVPGSALWVARRLGTPVQL